MKTEQKIKSTTPPVTDWPNTVRTRSELDAALEAAEQSGESRRTIAEIVAAAKAKYARG